MAVGQKITGGGQDVQIGGEGVGRTLGPIAVIAFDTVASLADGVALTSVQATTHIPWTHRIRGAWASIESNTGTVKFDVYDNAETPASIGSAAKTISAVDTATALALSDVAAPTKRAAAYYTLRAETAASTGALTKLRCFLEVEILS